MASLRSRDTAVVDRTRRRRRVTGLIVASVLILVWVLVIVLLWRGGALVIPLPGAAATRSPDQRPSEVAPTTAPVQPAAAGYEYLVTEERYAVIQDKGQLEIQERRRESWRTPDGWAWARQTGDDSGRFIFGPLPDWEPIRQVKPIPADVEKAMTALLVGVPRSKIVNAQFNFVSDLLGAETLPAGSLPIGYRSALVHVLSGKPGVTVRSHLRDPKGRPSTRLSFTRIESGARVTQSLYLDRKYQYLASTTAVEGSEESGSRVVIERRHASEIPPDLLAKVGDDRVERVIWGR